MRTPNKHYLASLKGKQVIVTPYKCEGFYWTEGLLSLHPAEDFEWVDETSVEELRERNNEAMSLLKYAERILSDFGAFFPKNIFEIAENWRSDYRSFIALSSPPESTESNK